MLAARRRRLPAETFCSRGTDTQTQGSTTQLHLDPARIREFRFPEDYEAALDLWRSTTGGVRVGASDSPAEIQKKLGRDPDLFLIAERDGKLIGTVIGGFDGRRGFIHHLAVAAAFRRTGVASALMQEVERRLRGKGCIRSYLLVRPDNAGARSYYERTGWSLLDDVVFAKDLG